MNYYRLGDVIKFGMYKDTGRFLKWKVLRKFDDAIDLILWDSFANVFSDPADFENNERFTYLTFSDSEEESIIPVWLDKMHTTQIWLPSAHTLGFDLVACGSLAKIATNAKYVNGIATTRNPDKTRYAWCKEDENMVCVNHSYDRYDEPTLFQLHPDEIFKFTIYKNSSSFIATGSTLMNLKKSQRVTKKGVANKNGYRGVVLAKRECAYIGEFEQMTSTVRLIADDNVIVSRPCIRIPIDTELMSHGNVFGDTIQFGKFNNIPLTWQVIKTGKDSSIPFAIIKLLPNEVSDYIGLMYRNITDVIMFSELEKRLCIPFTFHWPFDGLTNIVHAIDGDVYMKIKN